MVSDFSSKCKSFVQLNREGFIPGPLETESSFLKRVEQMKKRFQEEKDLSRADFEWVRCHIQELFDFKPHFFPLIYSNDSLPFWQGGATWIEEGNVITVQLRKGFQKGSYLGYSRDELVSHEWVHAARAAFNEDRFEEFFAYLASEKWWRRAVGPIIRRPWEAWPFLIGLSLGLFSPWGILASTLWMIGGLIRLIRGHRTLRKASNALMSLVQDKKIARAILFRLTDQEISLFAKGIDVISYGRNQKELRWQVILLAYFKGNL
jgi:hypothetical protein